MRRVWANGWRRHVRLALTQQQQRTAGVHSSKRLLAAVPNASENASGAAAVAAAAALALMTVAIDDASECEKSGSNGPVVARRGRYALYNEIGRGGFSVVRLAVDTKTDEVSLERRSASQCCAGAHDERLVLFGGCSSWPPRSSIPSAHRWTTSVQRWSGDTRRSMDEG